MLVIKIELWPGGDESRATTIGVGKIVNVGGDEHVADYRAEFCTIPGKGDPPLVVHRKPRVYKSNVFDYERARGAWRLLLRALAAADGIGG